MAKVKVPGASKAKGQRRPEPLIDGDYLVEIVKEPQVTPSERSEGDNWKFEMTVLDGPEQPDGNAPDGRKVYENIFIMHEDHRSYGQWGHLGVEHLKEVANACGVNVTGSDNIETSEFVGKTAVVTLRTEVPEMEDGKKGNPRNIIREWKSEEEA